MDNYCSPQWVDFTSISDVPLDDYFEKNHDACGYNKSMEIARVIITPVEKINSEEISEKGKVYEKLEEELNVIKNTPIKVICSSSSHNSSRREVIKNATYNDVLREAMEVFEHCISSKSDIFKKPMPTKNTVSKTLRFHAMDDNQVNVVSSKEMKQIKEETSNRETKVLSPSAIIKNHLIETKNDIDKKSLINSHNSNTSANNLLKSNESDSNLGVDNYPVFYTPTTCTKSLSVSNKQRQCKSLEKKSSSRRSKPLTYQCKRQSLKFRRHSNQYISLAAAVLKFQNETPERFHTKTTKDLKVKAASEKRRSFLTRKSIVAKSNLRRSIPVLKQKEEEESNGNIMKETLNEKITLKHEIEAPKTINSNCFSTKAVRKNNVVSTIVDNNGSEIVLKKEKILFFDIPIHTKQKKTTQPIPFSFEQRDKAKKQSTLEQLQLKGNKLGNIVRSQSIQSRQSCLQTKISTSSSNVKNNAQLSVNVKNSQSKKLKTNEKAYNSLGINNTLKDNSCEGSKNSEKKIAITSQNVKDTIKIKQSTSVSSLKPRKKTEDKNKMSEHAKNEDTKQLKKQSTSMYSLKLCEKTEDKTKINEHTQNKNIKQVKKQSTSTSSLKLCEKTEDTNKINEHTQNKDIKQLKKQSTSMSSINYHDKGKGMNKDKNTERTTQIKCANQIKKQSTLLVCQDKNKTENAYIENHKTKSDPNKSVSSTNQQCIDEQENREPNVNVCTSNNDLKQTGHMKLESTVIGMNSYERGKQRREFDEKLKQKIMMQEEMRKKVEAEKLAAEKLQIAMLRKQLEVKARPMPVFKPLTAIRSTKPLTEPQSPAWAYKKKKQIE